MGGERRQPSGSWFRTIAKDLRFRGTGSGVFGQWIPVFIAVAVGEGVTGGSPGQLKEFANRFPLDVSVQSWRRNVHG